MTAPTKLGTARARRRLPTVLYAHPFELALGLAFVIIGLRTLIEGSTTPAVDELPRLPLLLYRIASAGGGIGILLGLRFRQLPIGRAIERASLYTVAGAWLSYSVVVIAAIGWRLGFATYTLTTLIAVACILRGRAIRITERVILSTLRDANRDPDVDVLRQLIDGRPPTQDEDGSR